MTRLTTIDTLLDGQVVIEQPAPGHGYRVNVDALWLARFAAESVDTHHVVVDLGAGVGSVALVLHTLSPTTGMILVEKEPTVAELARRNLTRAGLESRAQVIEADVDTWSRTWRSDGPVLIVANPPYVPPGAGRPGKDRLRDGARQGDLTPFLNAIQRLLSISTGMACMCYPASHSVDAIDLAARKGLHPRRIRFVHPSASRSARIVLVEWVVFGTGLVVHPPWYDNEL